MRNRLTIQQGQQTSLRTDPKIVLSSQLLELSQIELESAIANELAENPALERLLDADPITDESILRSIAPSELRPSSEDFEFRKSLPQGSLDSIDWVDLAPTSDSLWDHLQAQLNSRVPRSERSIAQFVVGCVDERGYLSASLEEIALCCDCSLARAEFVLRELQACEPAGVGATNLRECLMLQLRDEDSLEAKLARSILKNYWDDFVDRNVRVLMRRYKVVPEVIEAAFEVITSLTPYPGASSSTSKPGRSLRQPAATPDIALQRDEAGWCVEVMGFDYSDLTVNRHYARKWKEVQESGKAPKDEKRHLGEYVDRANRFIESLRQRETTLRRLGDYLIEKQPGFIQTGEFQFLLPLTKTKVAKDLGVHESTISRATAEKFVQIATGEIVPFETFFKPALRVQKMIEEILAHENPNNPLSDERIAQMLADRGVIVARRTVNKYRDRTKLLSSRRRKSA